MWPVSLDCPFLMAHTVISNVYFSCVLCIQCGQRLLIVHSWWPIRLSLTFISPVSCVSNVASVSWLFILDGPYGYLSRLFLLCLVYPMWPVSLHCSFLIAHTVISNVYFPCVLCIQCGQCLLIVQSWLPIRLSLTFISPVSCVSNVASVAWLFILDDPYDYL